MLFNAMEMSDHALFSETIVASELGGIRTWNRARTRLVALVLTRNSNA
jgi:hypothetical protein